MPWQISDVERFKKGLSPEGKKKWVAIANAALFACEKKGGKGCDGRAVKIANGSVNESDLFEYDQRIRESGEYHRFRQVDPSGFKTFRNKEITPGIMLVLGIKSAGGSETQSVLFDKKKYSVDQAKAWLKKNNYKFGNVESDSFPVGKSNNIDIIESSSSISDYALAEIQVEEDAANPNSTKREMIVTLLKEGPGNQLHNNYYQKSALESAQKLLEQRPKQYYNHAINVDDPARDIRDWASSVLESWVDTTEPKAKLKARVKVFDNWLWERAKVAPDQLAVSVEGKGLGKPEVIDGKPYNAIRSIERLNGVNWVDYPGNAGMGVQLLESDQQKKQEVAMKLTDVLESIRTLTPAELEEVAKTRPELKEFFLFPPAGDDEKTKKELAALSEKVSTIQKEYEGKSKELAEKVGSLEKENLRLANAVEAHEIKEKSMSKEKLVESLLKASKLKEVHITETFKRQLSSVKEYKEGDKLISEEEQMKQLITDREKICIAEVAAPDNAGGSVDASKISEDEQHHKFALNVFGIDTKASKKKEDDDELATGTK